MVKFTINYRVNTEIRHEVKKHLREIEVIENCVLLIREKQWKQKQLNRVDVSPAFIQFVDDLGALVEKSPNLKAKQLNFYPNQKSHELFVEPYGITKMLGKHTAAAQTNIQSNDRSSSK